MNSEVVTESPNIAKGSLYALAAFFGMVVYAKAAQIGIYQYSSVVFVGLLDWLFWGVIPSSVDAVGVLLVAIAGIIIIRSGRDS